MAHLLSSTVQKLMKILLDNPGQEFKEIELIRAAGTGKGAAGTLLTALAQEGFLSIRRVGRSKVISLSLSSPEAFFLKQTMDREKLQRLPKPRLAAVLLFVEKISEEAALVVLFGSTIAGTATPGSDIDFLIISSQPSALASVQKKIEELLGEKLNLHLYQEQEAVSAIKTDSLLLNALKQGIILHGYDVAQKLYSKMESRTRTPLDRILYFKERLAAAQRNYLHQDYASAEEIVKQLQEQLIFYLLTQQGLAYRSRKDALEKIKGLPEGKIIMATGGLKGKIDKLGALIRSVLINTIIGAKNDGLASGN